MEKTESQREKEYIVNDGFRYRTDRANKDGSVSWRCSKHDCKGRLKVLSDVDRTVTTEHNHAPEPERNEAKRTMVEIRRQATTTVKKPRQIIQHCSEGISLPAASFLPSLRLCSGRLNEEDKETTYLGATSLR